MATWGGIFSQKCDMGLENSKMAWGGAFCNAMTKSNKCVTTTFLGNSSNMAKWGENLYIINIYIILITHYNNACARKREENGQICPKWQNLPFFIFDPYGDFENGIFRKFQISIFGSLWRRMLRGALR